MRMADRARGGPRRSPARPVRRSYRSEGLRLGYIDWGGRDLPHMLLVHDLGDSPRTWDLLAPGMRGSYRVFAPEMRGHGESDRPAAAAYGHERLYADIAAFASEVGLTDAVAVGHGAGARLAARLAAEAPSAVSALVVYDLEAGGDHEQGEWGSFDELVDYLCAQRPGAERAVLDRQARSLTGGGLDGRRAFKHDSAAYPSYMLGRAGLWDEWGRVRCPALVLRGRLSADLTHAEAVRIAESVERRRLAEIEGAGRWLHQEMPGAFEDALRWFLDSPPP